MSLPIALGTHIEPYGTIEAIAWLGERYYFFADGKYVAMIPAFMVESARMAAGDAGQMEGLK